MTIISGINNNIEQFEKIIRADVVKSALALNQSGVQFKTFEKSHCNEQYWTRTANGGFLLKPSIKPSAAITDIYTNGALYGFECATAIIIVFYKSVLASLGESLFNQLFDSLYVRDWHYDADLRLTAIQGQNPKPGDAVYFRNPDVDPLMPQWQGENAIVIANDLYYGHGVGVKSGKDIIDSLNRYRKRDSHRTAYLTDTIIQLDYPYLFSLIHQ